MLTLRLLALFETVTLLVITSFAQTFPLLLTIFFTPAPSREDTKILESKSITCQKPSQYLFAKVINKCAFYFKEDITSRRTQAGARQISQHGNKNPISGIKTVADHKKALLKYCFKFNRKVRNVCARNARGQYSIANLALPWRSQRLSTDSYFTMYKVKFVVRPAILRTRWDYKLYFLRSCTGLNSPMKPA